MWLMDDSLGLWVINWMNEWFTIIRVGEIVLSIKKILEKMKWAEEVEKGDVGLGQIQGHIQGHDLGRGQGTFKIFLGLGKSKNQNFRFFFSENPDAIVREGIDIDRKMKILAQIRTL